MLERRPQDAVRSFHQALRLEPNHVIANNNLGLALAGLNQFEEAVPYYREALRLQPSYVEARANLSLALLEIGQVEEALELAREVLLVRHDSPDAHINLGTALMAADQEEEAVASFRNAQRLAPNHAVPYNNLAVCFQKHGQFEEAEEYFREAIRLRPNYPDAHKNLALVYLVLGDLERGWREYEWRWECKDFGTPPFVEPRWDGSPLEGRTILLFGEQGLGDMLQFIRYVPMVAAQGGRVLLYTAQALVDLFAGCEGITRIIPDGSPIPPFDVQAPIMSLPAIFNTTLATIPAEVPYIRVATERYEYWKQQLSGISEFKVGVAWQGNPKHKSDRLRSVRLAQLAPLASIPGVRLISLQKGAGTEQLPHASFPVMDLCSTLGFVDTAAVMRNLDLVVCIDSAMAHLAGSLAVPVWVALSPQPDFRWLLEREDTPWYPTMRLFRQDREGGWQPVFERMGRELGKILAENRQ
jgi:Flp pilus assembly protein TadD